MLKKLTPFNVNLFVMILLLALSGCEADKIQPPAAAAGDGNSDGDTDGDGDSDGDSDGDIDSDSGSTVVDSGLAWDPNSDCDCPDLSGDSAENFARSMNICPDEDYFNSVKTQSTHSNGPTVGMEVLESQGSNDCLKFQQGCKMFAMSTGTVDNPNPNKADGMGAGLVDTNFPDPMPKYQGDKASGGSDYAVICDTNQLKVNLTAPAGAEGFSFDFLFASSEYDEWMNLGYNDTFYAILEHPDVNGGATTNISFDSNGNEIEVDSNFFENSDFPCNEAGSGWGTNLPGIAPDFSGFDDPAKKAAGFSLSGSTGWLRTSYPIKGGDTFSLTFSIHDEGDCVYDSIVFLDNFQWSGKPVINETKPPEIE